MARFELIKSKGIFKDYRLTVPPQNGDDALSFLTSMKSEINRVAMLELEKLDGVKFKIVLTAELGKLRGRQIEEGELVVIMVYIHSVYLSGMKEMR